MRRMLYGLTIFCFSPPSHWSQTLASPFVKVMMEATFIPLCQISTVSGQMKESALNDAVCVTQNRLGHLCVSGNERCKL